MENSFEQLEMTLTPATLTPAPLPMQGEGKESGGAESGRVMIRVGDVIRAWCRVHGVESPKRFMGNRLVCLLCEAEVQNGKVG